MDEAAVAIDVQPVLRRRRRRAGQADPAQAEPALSEAGLYEATYVPRLTGGFRATAVVTNAVGAEVGRAEAGWSADLGRRGVPLPGAQRGAAARKSRVGPAAGWSPPRT